MPEGPARWCQACPDRWALAALSPGRGAGLSPGGTLRREDEGRAQRHGPQPTAPTPPMSNRIQAQAPRWAEARNAANCTVWPLVVLWVAPTWAPRAFCLHRGDSAR